jgi:hypothetical protein
MKALWYLLLFTMLCAGCEDDLLAGYNGSYEIVWMQIDGEQVIPDDTGLARGTVVLVPINKNRIDNDDDIDMIPEEDALMTLSYYSPQEEGIISWSGDFLRVRPGQERGIRIAGKASVIDDELEFLFLARGTFMFRPHPFEPGQRVSGMARRVRN